VNIAGFSKGGVALRKESTSVSFATLGMGVRRFESFLAYFLTERGRESGRSREDSEEKLERRMVGVVGIAHVVEGLRIPNGFDLTDT